MPHRQQRAAAVKARKSIRRIVTGGTPQPKAKAPAKKKRGSRAPAKKRGSRRMNAHWPDVKSVASVVKNMPAVKVATAVVPGVSDAIKAAEYAAVQAQEELKKKVAEGRVQAMAVAQEARENAEAKAAEIKEQFEAEAKKQVKAATTE